MGVVRASPTQIVVWGQSSNPVFCCGQAASVRDLYLIAEDHCAQYGRQARRRYAAATRDSMYARQRITYDCIVPEDRRRATLGLQGP